MEVKDLGSSNGTCINGARVSAGHLAVNDTVTFGKVVFRLLGAGSVPAIQRPAIAAEAGPGGQIVRQLVVSGGVPPGITSRDVPSAGQLRVGATTGEARQSLKLQMLLEVSQKLSSELDLDRLLRTVVDTTFEIMSVDRVTIALLGEGTEELVPTISRSRLGDLQPVQVPHSIADKVMQERVAVVSQNTPADSRFRGQSIVQQSVRSAMCSPLMASPDRVLGLLYVDNLTATNTFSDEDLQFLVAFSGLAAVGIKNSRYADQIRREATVRSNFERYFAPNVAADIAQQDAAIRQGGERRPTTVLFSDIRGFTAMAESMGPDAIAQLLSEYFTEMVEVIFEHGGTLDKFIGDAIMALWGAPIAHTDDPDRALRAAVAMQRSIGRAQRALAEPGPAGDRRRHRHQPRRRVRRQHRQPPPARVHRHRRRGERGRPALRRGWAGGDSGDRVVSGNGAGPGVVGVPAGDGSPGQGADGTDLSGRGGSSLSRPRSPPRCRSGPRSGRAVRPARAGRAPAGGAGPSR